VVDGWEVNYQQQFSFLPGIWKGLSFSANYTKLDTEGDYGTTGARSTDEIARFVPETGNARLSYTYGKYGMNLLYNYVGPALWTYNASFARLQYRDSRNTVNLGFSYRHSRGMNFFVDFTNLFNEPQTYYRAFESRLERATYNGTAVTFGVSGSF
jgi:outer membrane receptor protein involved in Fe transport